MEEKAISDSLTTRLGSYKTALEQVYNHVIITDTEGIIIYANKSAETHTGYLIGEMIGKTPALWGKQMEASFYKEMWGAIKAGKPYKAEFKNRKKNGEFYFAIVTITPIIGQGGKIDGFIGIEEDISVLKEVDIFFETSKDLMCIANVKGYFEKVNDAFETILGYNRDEILSQPILDLVHDDDKQMTQAEIEKLARGLKTTKFLNRYKKKDGRYVWLDWSATPQNDKLFAVARDVTKERDIDRMKSEFISLASHQLRTPLTATKWFLERLSKSEGGHLNDVQLDLVSKSISSNEQTISLVNSLLNITRIESGRIIVDRIETDLQKLLMNVIDESKLKYLDKEQTVEFRETDKLPHVYTDPILVSNILTNLLTNALKYSPGKAIVHVSLSKDGEFAVFEIKDSGYGIPKEEQSKIFTKFFRSSNIVDKEAEGTGLGLYLVKLIVDTLSGKISFESEENKGTLFKFSLPLKGTVAREGEVRLTS